MKHEVSAGIVLFRREHSEVLFLLLHYPQGHWDFPKGHVEPGESLIDAAKRELKEETGIEDVKIYPFFKEKISYYFMVEGERRYKEVYFFLGETNVKEVVLSFEHQGYGWFTYTDALKTITYENSKRVLKNAMEFIKSRIIGA